MEDFLTDIFRQFSYRIKNPVPESKPESTKFHITGMAYQRPLLVGEGQQDVIKTGMLIDPTFGNVEIS